MNPVLPAVLMLLCTHLAQSLPRFHHRGWLRLLGDEDGCVTCRPDLCPQPAGCTAGTVLDACGCCPECGNAEGQICDIDNTNHFYGRCGEGLECRLDADAHLFGEIPEPQCACRWQESVCASDRRTYSNICRMKEALLSLLHQGPCQTAPWIASPPHNTHDVAGNDVIFSCEVSAYPMALVEWRKKGNEDFLPGDDAHISVQVRGGPERHGITGWLQIQGLKKSDEGIYICYTWNKYGEALASARLSVSDPDSPSAVKMNLYLRDIKDITDEDKTDSDNEDEKISGDYEL